LHATTYFSSVDEKEDIPMTGDDLPTSLEDNEVLIYVRPPGTADAAAQRALPWEPTLRKVEISDEELDRLRRQVGWIAGRLADTDDVDERFAVDAVTLHVGINATGNFIWASAGVEVAVDVTWKRTDPPG
jgi:hypothetical protein